MTESRTYITEDVWFPCDTCGEQITHNSVHSCFVMNPDILPTQKEWRLICKMIKQQRELTDEEIIKMVGVGLDEFRAILKKAREK